MSVVEIVSTIHGPTGARISEAIAELANMACMEET
jgi:hypothetical protein